MRAADLIVLLNQNQFNSWSWLKKTLMAMSCFVFIVSNFLFLTPLGLQIREKMAETVIMTQHREWAWLVVGANKRDQMVTTLTDNSLARGVDPINPNLIVIKNRQRSQDNLIQVKDISGPRWVGKKIYVYDPTSIRVVVPPKPGEGERITSMVERTGAVAGINGGGFDDPDGLGNGFAAIGLIMSGGELLYTGLEGSIPQQVVGFTDKGLLIVGNYSIDKLLELHVREAVTFAPRIIANGVPLITNGDGGSGIQPRTAVGQRADGVVIFIVIDGRQAHSVGATEREVQDLFIEEEVVNAGFLDGGASAELVVKGQGLVSKPSSRYGERRLPTGFLVFADPTSYKATRVWDGLKVINPGGAFDNPDFLNEQAELRRLGKLPTPVPSIIEESPSSSPQESASPTSTIHSSVSGSPTPSASMTASEKPGTTSTFSPTPSPVIAPTGSTLPEPTDNDGSSTVTPTATPLTTLTPEATGSPNTN